MPKIERQIKIKQPKGKKGKGSYESNPLYPPYSKGEMWRDTYSTGERSKP
jgi:stalled ribosome alternative rescue factor ArfA